MSKLKIVQTEKVGHNFTTKKNLPNTFQIRKSHEFVEKIQFRFNILFGGKISREKRDALPMWAYSCICKVFSSRNSTPDGKHFLPFGSNCARSSLTKRYEATVTAVEQCLPRLCVLRIPHCNFYGLVRLVSVGLSSLSVFRSWVKSPALNLYWFRVRKLLEWWRHLKNCQISEWAPCATMETSKLRKG